MEWRRSGQSPNSAIKLSPSFTILFVSHSRSSEETKSCVCGEIIHKNVSLCSNHVCSLLLLNLLFVYNHVGLRYIRVIVSLRD